VYGKKWEGRERQERVGKGRRQKYRRVGEGRER